MNLINDPWIPIRRKSGKVDRIAPWQISDGMSADEIIELAAPRPDFNGALVQFIIGLLQTTFSPENARLWKQRLQSPPRPEELKGAFNSVAYAFELDGDGPRFMQDMLLKEEDCEFQPINYLLIDSPTDNTIKNNIDWFVKRNALRQAGSEIKFCAPCAASALFTMQTFAPSGGGGGGGKFTSLRGGGPLSTLVLGNTLWETLWLNVIEARYFSSKKKYPPEHIFAWLKPDKFIKDRIGRAISSDEMSPLHLYWGMPRRIFLDFEDDPLDNPCSICSNSTKQRVKQYRDATMGINYFQGSGNMKKPSWIFPLHPLTPYYKDQTGHPFAVHPTAGGITYRHWIGLVHADGERNRYPAQIIEESLRRTDNQDFRLWAYGYDMENMKARCWYDSTMPIPVINEMHRTEYRSHVICIIKAAEWCCGALLLGCLRACYFNPTANKDGHIIWKVPKTWDRFGRKNEEDIENLTMREEKTFLETIRSRFWQETEPDFFDLLRQLRNTLREGHEVIAILEHWHKCLVRRTITVFNDVSQTGAFESADPKRIALAWNELRKSLYGEKLRKLLGLPEKTQAAL